MTTETKTQTHEQQIAAIFRRDTAKHKLTVLHDDGLYRHLRLSAPSTGHAWYELVTWPGTLTIRGGMGAYTFSRTTDMLDFFRRSAYAGQPNLHYWEEKADAIDVHSGTRGYSEDLLRERIAEDVARQAEDDLDDRLRSKAEELGMRAEALPPALVEECQAASSAYMIGLREELDDELTGGYPTWDLQDEGDALAGVRQFSYRPDDAPRDEEPFTFDTTEWEVRDWTHHYVWCCHAILFGIAAYDRAKAEQPAPELAASAAREVEAEAAVPALAVTGV
jgi:hypothetical protein